MEAVTVVAPAINIGPDSVLWFTINQTNDSSLPPILNAFEIYAVTKLSHAATNQHDGQFSYMLCFCERKVKERGFHPKHF